LCAGFADGALAYQGVPIPRRGAPHPQVGGHVIRSFLQGQRRLFQLLELLDEELIGDRRGIPW
jgi:hypothetical protein